MKNWIWKNRSLRDRIILILVIFLMATASFIGYFAIKQSRLAVLQLVEQRVDREVTLFYEVAQTSKIVYFDDEERYMDSLNAFVKKQNAEMVQDDLNSQFYYIQGDDVSAFKTSGRFSRGHIE